MRISTHCPELAALRLAVEQKFGSPIRVPRHFTSLSFDMEETLKEYLSETTLQRVWHYKSGYNTVSINTLNVLCHYIGYSDWDKFCLDIKSSTPIESLLFEGDSIRIADLDIGTVIKIGWLPDRVCLIKYLGGFRFEALETHNSKLSAGDIFTCVGIQKGRPMCIENLVRGNSDMSYVIGSKNGLTSLEIIEAE